VPARPPLHRRLDRAATVGIGHFDLPHTRRSHGHAPTVEKALEGKEMLVAPVKSLARMRKQLLDRVF
jgi:hypothetical protein